jgi:hypothetical protein
MLVLAVAGCHYYEEYRVLKSKADIQDEKAELLRAYRNCLVKHQEDPPKVFEKLESNLKGLVRAPRKDLL